MFLHPADSVPQKGRITCSVKKGTHMQPQCFHSPLVLEQQTWGRTSIGALTKQHVTCVCSPALLMCSHAMWHLVTCTSVWVNYIKFLLQYSMCVDRHPQSPLITWESRGQPEHSMCLHVSFYSCSTEHTLILPHLCCYAQAQAVTFSLNNTDMQCAYNRSGLLCGACKKGYSRVLATSHCKQCTSSHLALLIPFV